MTLLSALGVPDQAILETHERILFARPVLDVQQCRDCNHLSSCQQQGDDPNQMAVDMFHVSCETSE